jgi:aspartate/methionine/tyrosine aminotransferase
MVPVPSYPLFDHLAALDAVRVVPYRLDYHGRWTLALDEEELDRRGRSTIRAVIAVSPNNPTGSVLNSQEYLALADFCAARGAALIVDEVFADYPIPVGPTAGCVAPSRMPGDVLSFRLGGLSKSAGLPQVKLGWMLVDGPDTLVREAVARLEVICDTYLSVSTPVQVAARSLIAEGATVRAQIQARIRANDATLRRLARDYPSIDVLPAEAGWSSVVRVPSTTTEEDLVVGLLERDDVLVHPGFFFDFPHEAFVIVSLLAEPDTFAGGVRLVMERAHA